MVAPADALVVVAHPDDAEFGVSGTVAKWIREGKEVVYVVCTSGEKGTSDRSMDPGRLAQIREKEQEAAARVLGVREVVFLRFPDQGLEDTAEFRKMIARQIRMYRPKTVVTSDPYRRYLWHRDHRIVGQVTLDAVFPFARDHLAYPDLLEEGLEPHKVREMLFVGSEDINYRTDITETFDKKIAALRCHESQMKELTVPDLEAWMREWACSMAEGADCELAEAFHRIEITR
ncbi:MAG TPA: PIG-L deacetylase family protein [Thermodesulfovibrionales bacterium]|jgi:LmbE family N-acetylglucosaminyl deacetylase|nr:PIG-L deacetylase family protein [Thermodesulfovibrionales bacterium]